MAESIEVEIEALKAEPFYASAYLVSNPALVHRRNIAIDRTVAIMDRRVRELREALDAIEGQAVCVNMDGDDGNEWMLRRCAELARTALGKPDGGRG